MPRPVSLPRLRPLTDFLRTEAGSATVLLAATIAALVWANSPAADLYDRLWHAHLTVGVGDLAISEDLTHWVNDGLMALFFFVVGLEIKRELAEGDLRDPQAAALPVLAALGGLAVPALVYLAFNLGSPTVGGWGIPVATDIAFALGVLGLLGRRVPSGLKVFLLTLAIADDVGAILIIAVAYSKGIDPGWLAAAVGGLVAVGLLRRWVSSPWAYVPLAIFVWVATLESGVHATIAGVALGLMTPAGTVGGRAVLAQLEHRLHPVTSYGVLPLFALANAGVVLDAAGLTTALTSRVTIGIVVGLLVGKTLGIAAGTWVGLRSGVGRLPLGVERRQLLALAPMGGIGFTVSLFIADLTFAAGADLDAAKIGVLIGSVVSAGVGGWLVARATRAGRPSGADDRSLGGRQRTEVEHGR